MAHILRSSGGAAAVLHTLSLPVLHPYAGLERGRVLRVAVTGGAGLLVLVATGWAGLQVPPTALPAYRRGAPAGSVPIPTHAPAPVLRYYRAVFVDGVVPRTHSAVISGRGRMRLGAITFLIRWRFVHQYSPDGIPDPASRRPEGYRHLFEGTWFGLPLFRAGEWYLDGRLRMETPGGTIADNPTADAAANLAFWGEALPSVLATDPRVRWEAMDETSARLVVPSPKSGGEDAFTVTFDQRNGLIRTMDVPRYRLETNQTLPWRVEASEWRTFDGMRLSSVASARWLDQAAPWLTLTTDEVVTNVDVAEYIRARGSRR